MSREPPDARSADVAVSFERTRRRPKPDRKRRADASFAYVRRPSTVGRLAGEVWGAMVHAVFARKDRMAAVAATFDLTLPQAHLLRLLQFGPARTMTSIADALACDASNVTGIVDRLETRGLIARGNADHDRRIKTIALTTRGKQVLNHLTAGFLEPPKELRSLPEPELRRLRNTVIHAFGHWPNDMRCPGASPDPTNSKPHVFNSRKS